MSAYNVKLQTWQMIRVASAITPSMHCTCDVGFPNLTPEVKYIIEELTCYCDVKIK